MKKSILLSSFIMLLILFVTLTTTTFAWYQASAGNITISGSSTASVTTTGPDSPYLVIAKDTSSALWTDGKTISQITSNDYADHQAALTTINFDSSSTTHYLEYFNANDVNVFGTNRFKNPITNENGTPYCLTFYIKSTAETLPLSTKIKVLNGNLALSNNYCYALTFSSGVYNSTNSSAITYINSSYHYISGLSLQSASPSASYDGVNNGFDVVVRGTSVITVNFYLWLDGSGVTDNNSGSLTSVISNLKIIFSDVNIYTS